MTFPLVSPELAEVARETYARTEAALKERGLALPYPEAKKLPWGVSTAYNPVDSGGGSWRTGDACKRQAGLIVVASVGLKTDNQLWYQVSLSRGKKTPSYEDMAWVKELWMGDLWAIQCFVPKAEHVNIHANCLHLWHCMSAPRPFPEFAVQGSI